MPCIMRRIKSVGDILIHEIGSIIYDRQPMKLIEND